jgi:transcriptional regulator with XRE-family HTH domain
MARHKTFLRQWRKHRDKTLEAVSDHLHMSHSQLSRIERGEQPYSQDLLEALSVVLRSSPPALLNVDPGREDGIMSIWDTLSPPQRVQLVEIGKTLKRTGTDG